MLSFRQSKIHIADNHLSKKNVLNEIGPTLTYNPQIFSKFIQLVQDIPLIKAWRGTLCIPLSYTLPKFGNKSFTSYIILVAL